MIHLFLFHQIYGFLALEDNQADVLLSNHLLECIPPNKLVIAVEINHCKVF